MKKSLSIITLIACMIGFGGFAFCKETANNDSIKDELDSSVIKSMIEERKAHRQREKLPHQLKDTFKFFKLADELKYTDDQIIKLRAYYKNYYSDESAKKEEINKEETPEIQDFYGMSENDLKKYAKDKASIKEKEIMAHLQKIIDLKKILTPDS